MENNKSYNVIGFGGTAHDFTHVHCRAMSSQGSPADTRNCAMCHVNGSEQEVCFLCLECHSNIGVQRTALGNVPPAFHDLLSPRFQNLICHQKVHGSHVDRNFPLIVSFALPAGGRKTPTPESPVSAPETELAASSTSAIGGEAAWAAALMLMEVWSI